jgi:hypothetical protein
MGHHKLRVISQMVELKIQLKFLSNIRSVQEAKVGKGEFQPETQYSPPLCVGSKCPKRNGGNFECSDLALVLTAAAVVSLFSLSLEVE